MTSPDTAIRDLIATWHRATAEDDLAAILPLMAEDVVFLTAGRPPMLGRTAFATAFAAASARFSIRPRAEVAEIVVDGNLAYCRADLTVTMTPRDGGTAIRREGPALTILRRGDDGRWVVTRDANLLSTAVGSA